MVSVRGSDIRHCADMRVSEKPPVLIISRALEDGETLDCWEEEWMEKFPMCYGYGDIDSSAL